MAIEKGSRIGRRNGPEVDGVQGYDWFTYCTNELANLVQSGNHKPTVEQMLDAGCMIVVLTAYDPATHKLVPDSFGDNGMAIKQNTVGLTAEEITTASTKLKSSLVAHTKTVAYQLIVAKIVEWKQRNLTALAVKNNHKLTVALFVDRFLLPTETDPVKITEYEGIITTAEVDFLNDYATNEAIEATYDGQVTPIRSASDDIEAEIEAGLITTEEQIDNHIAWEV